MSLAAPTYQTSTAAAAAATQASSYVAPSPRGVLLTLSKHVFEPNCSYQDILSRQCLLNSFPATLTQPLRGCRPASRKQQ